MARRSVKLPFSKFIKNIAAETLEQQLGYVDAEKTTQLILYPEPKQIIVCIQKNAACSPDTLGENLGLRPHRAVGTGAAVAAMAVPHSRSTYFF